jgi:hypothetical protein
LRVKTIVDNGIILEIVGIVFSL